MIARILLVEDNPSDVELVQTAFAEVGIPAIYTVFRDGDEAIAGIKVMAQDEQQPQLVLIDLNLPRTSGHAVLTCLRSLPAFVGVPVVILSTSGHPQDRSRCLSEGANDYQVKPPRFGDLLTLVERFRDRWLTISA